MGNALGQPRDTMFTAHAAIHLRQRHHHDSRITDSDDCAQLVECTRFEDRERIENLVHLTFPVCRIDDVRQFNNPQMYGMYLLRKEEMLAQNNRSDVRELLLYHVTTRSKGEQSLKRGLDWRLTRRSKFGCGVSFSDDADYADFYANHSNHEDSRVILVCTVLVATTYKVKNNPNAGYSLAVPPGTADTTVRTNGRVYVKYNDFEFYPLYLVYYRRKPGDRYLSKYFTTNSLSRITR